MGKKIVCANDRYHEYAVVDIAKFFFCICILFLHTGAYHEVRYEKYVLYDLLRVAVPFFFIASGYFFGCKLWEKDGNSVKKKLLVYEKKLFYPYLFFTVVNSLLAAYDLYCSGESVKWTMLRLARAALFYPYGALWYVWASMTGMIIVSFFVKRKALKLACVCAAICYCVALLTGSYCFLLDGTVLQKGVDLYLHIAISGRNGLFVGFPLLLTGVILSKYRSKIVMVGKIFWIAATIFTAAFILLQGEVLWVTNQHNSYEKEILLSQPFMAATILVLLLNCKWSGNPATMRLIRKLSTAIYFVHRPLLTCMRYFWNWTKLELSYMQQFFWLTALCLGICVPACLLWKKRRAV